LPRTAKKNELNKEMDKKIGRYMQMFLEKLNLPWKPFEVARRVSVQMVADLPPDIAEETLANFYENKTQYEFSDEVKTYKKSGGYYYNKMPYYALPQNDGTLAKLSIHISEDQIKRYFAGGTQIPISILYAFCKVVGSSLDIFMDCVNGNNKWADISLTMLTGSDTGCIKPTLADNLVNLSSYGITAIIEPDEMERRFNVELETATSAYFIYHALYEFIFKRCNIFVQKINQGCHYKFLLGCNENSEFMQELSLVNTGEPNFKTARIGPSLETFKMIKHKLINSDATGTLEVRSYNTEKRNSAAIFIGEGYVKAFLVVLTPPKSARRCIALEYNNEQCTDVVNYFNTIWNRHEGDVYV